MGNDKTKEQTHLLATPSKWFGMLKIANNSIIITTLLLFLSCVGQRCVQVLLDHAVSLLYRPKHLKRLINNTAAVKDTQNISDEDTFDDEVKAMNV